MVTSSLINPIFKNTGNFNACTLRSRRTISLLIEKRPKICQTQPMPADPHNPNASPATIPGLGIWLLGTTTVKLWIESYAWFGLILQTLFSFRFPLRSKKRAGTYRKLQALF